ncbi:MAG TPA: hypothetical protein VIL85_28085 [Thermomicrobiales bacterium]|jgi:hypothetical protein
MAGGTWSSRRVICRQDGRTTGRQDGRTTGRQDDRTAGRQDEPAQRQDSEPLEAAYHVTPAEIEQAVSRTSAQYMGDLRTMLAEVGKVYEGQLAAKDAALEAKDQALTTKDQVISTQAETIAELRRRAEQAEAERDRLAAAQAAPDAPGATEPPTPDNPSPDAPPSFWARVRRVFTGDEGS